MAHTNETSNYGLTQFIGSDKPAWLVDYNGDMLAIDTAMKAISDVADAAKSKADTNETNIATVTTTANSASAKASGAISDISDEYDPTSTYDLGDLVIYNNLLYKCTTAITVPEAFDGTHWTRTTIEELVDTINSNLSDLIVTTVETLTVTFATGIQGQVLGTYTKSGYTLIGITPIALTGGSTTVFTFQANSDTNLIYMSTDAEWAQTDVTIKLRLIWLKN